MRIIGGKHRGRVLCEFEGRDIRPTSDRAREALFNILQFKIENAVFYDGFCGSGSVGIEAISRGAKTVVMTDISKTSVELTKKNLSLVKEKATVELCDAVEFLKRTSLKFDIVFFDPPYADEKAVEALKIIAERKLLNEGGLAIYEHKSGDNRVIDELTLTSTRKYGIAEFDFYKDKL